jgi:hypothetical protein
MMTGKNHNGFLLMEAVFALFIASVLLATLFGSISSLVKHVHSERAHFERILIAKEFLLRTLCLNNEKDERETKKDLAVTSPFVALTYTEDAISQKSAFKTLKNLVLVRVNYRWELFFRGYSEYISLYSYVPESTQKEKT